MSVPIVFLMGPTASGKTQLAVQLVQEYPFEIISVDSAMVYRGLNIGTAKPKNEILEIAPHHLIDICDPIDSYSVAQFRHDALIEIQKIMHKQKVPLLVGGTMLYFHALQNGLSDLPTSDEAVRKKLFKEGKELGWPHLHERLKKIDPIAAMRIHPNDSQRLQRALEVYEQTGKTLTTWLEEKPKISNLSSIVPLALIPSDRNLLHHRIEKRFEAMLAEGLVEEVQGLFSQKGLSQHSSSMRSVGYRQVWQYLLGELTYSEMQNAAVVATRQLAKRQLTWLRNWIGVQQFESENIYIYDKLRSFIDNFI